MKVLLTGANGQLGRSFLERVPSAWEILATDSDSLDITDLDKVEKTIRAFKPDVIVNAAAYTAVDQAEINSELAELINVQGPSNLALVAKAAHCRLVHVSTDYVFDGYADRPYCESDETNPLGVYGKTKREGEIAVTTIQPEAIIIRTAWVFSEYGNNFLKTMLRLAKEHDVLGIVADQRGCPTYAGDIATAIIDLLKVGAEGGIYHFCGDKDVAWNEFAEFIFTSALVQGVLTRTPRVNAISTDQYPTAAQRPKYSLLNCEKIKAHGIVLSHWQERVRSIVKRFSAIES